MKLFEHTYGPAVLAMDMGMSGKDADKAIKMYGSVLVKKQPFLGIPLPSIDYLKTMVASSDLKGIYKFQGQYSICAFFKHDKYFPIARSYYMSFSSISDCMVIAQYICGNSNCEELSDYTIFAFTEHQGYEQRVDDFFDKIEQKHANFKGLFKGRKENTITESAMFLGSDGCLVCGADDEHMFNTTVSADKGVLFGFNLCKEHAEECSRASSNFDYLSSVMGITSPFPKHPFAKEDMEEMVVDMLMSEFDCRIDKVEGDTITAFRNISNFKLVFRLSSELNYGYMIYQPGRKKEVARFDSADHHDIPYGPDHLHKNVKKKSKEKPVPSFTTGFPVVDKVALKTVLEEKEAIYFSNLDSNPKNQ